MADLSKAKVGDKIKTAVSEFVVTRVTPKCVFARHAAHDIFGEYRFNKETGRGAGGVVAELVERGGEIIEPKAKQEVVAENTSKPTLSPKVIAAASKLDKPQVLQFIELTEKQLIKSAEDKGSANEEIFELRNELECLTARLAELNAVVEVATEAQEQESVAATATPKTDGATIVQTDTETSDFKFLQRLYELDIEFTEKYCDAEECCDDVNYVINCGKISKNCVSAYIVQYETGLCKITPVDQTWGTVCSGNLNAVLHLFNLVATSSK